jgi:RNA recognition motif-containing protein
MDATKLFYTDPVCAPFGIKVSPWIIERRKYYQDEAWDKMLRELKTTSTVYVGNLSFFTTEEQIYEMFSQCGTVKKIVMGLNSQIKTPCGFCFVVFETHEEACASKKFISGMKLDDRIIRCR